MNLTKSQKVSFKKKMSFYIMSSMMDRFAVRPKLSITVNIMKLREAEMVQSMLS